MRKESIVHYLGLQYCVINFIGFTYIYVLRLLELCMKRRKNMTKCIIDLE